MVSPGSIGADGAEHVDGVEPLLGPVVGSLHVQEHQTGTESGNHHGNGQENYASAQRRHPFAARSSGPGSVPHHR